MSTENETPITPAATPDEDAEELERMARVVAYEREQAEEQAKRDAEMEAARERQAAAALLKPEPIAEPISEETPEIEAEPALDPIDFDEPEEIEEGVLHTFGGSLRGRFAIAKEETAPEETEDAQP